MSHSSRCVFGLVALVTLIAVLSLPAAAQLLGLVDSLSHPPPALGLLAYNAFVPPVTVGASYIDPVFGTTVLRVTTDHAHDDLYARNMWWNADETRYLHRNPNGTAYEDFMAVINVATGQVTHNGIPIGTLPGDEGFDPVNPNVLYYHSGASIHQVTLNANGTWTDAVYFTSPGGQALLGLGGTINWLDASGRYMVVRYGPEPSVYLYDRQNLAAGPYAHPVDGASTIDAGSYVGLTPDGQFLVGYQGANGTAGLYGMGQGVSWKIDHANRAVAATETVFWSLCGDHGTFISPSDGRDYMVVSNCNDYAELWRVDVANSIAGLDETGQKALPNNFRLIAWPTWAEVGSHVSTVATGPLRDWAFYATEDGTDTFNTGTVDVTTGDETPWHAYRQEIVAFNVLTGETRRLAQHRSRSIDADYYAMPRVSTSWGGRYVGWASNFNQNGVIDIYALQFAAATADVTPPTVSVTAPLVGAILTGPATLSATASDNVGVASVQFLLDGGALGPVLTTAPYTITWTPTVALNGLHTLSAVARDAAGNSATATSVLLTVTLVTTTPPAISNVSSGVLSSSGATITWTTNEGADSQADYGATTAYGSSTPLNATMVTSHSQALSGLASGALYHYRVKSRDAAGNLATSSDFSFTTTPVATTAGLVGAWSFDEGSGTIAADSTGNHNTGTLVNGPAWTSGVINGALSFNGAGSYVAVANTPALDAFPLTVSVWIKTSSTAGVRGIVNKYVAGSHNGYNLFLNNGALCGLYFRDAKNYAYDGSTCTLKTTGFNDGNWHLATLTVDTSGSKLFVDGVQRKALAWTGTAGAPTTIQPLHFADYPGASGGAEYFAGILDDVRIYNQALSAVAVAALYSAAGVTSAPVNMTWTQLVNVTATSTTLTKTAGCDGCGDAGAISQQQIASGNGSVQFTAPGVGPMLVVGLTNGNPGTDGDGIAFGIRLQSDAEVWEHGAYQADTTLSAGDVFKVSVEAGIVNYYKNGAVFYSSRTAPVYPLIVDAAIYNINGSITNTVIKTGP